MLKSSPRLVGSSRVNNQAPPITIKILESNFDQPAAKENNKKSYPSQITPNNNLQAPSAESPEIIRRSSKNVISKLQGRSLTASMRSVNNQKEQAFFGSK